MALPSVRDGLVVGVDIGGTKVAAGLVDPVGEILCHSRNPMVCSDGAADGLDAVTKAIGTASLQARRAVGAHNLIHGIGVCSPGPLDPKTGVVINPPNLPCWRNYPLVAELARIYRVQVRLDNDANAAGLAETLWGAGFGYRNVFYVTLGTGIGTAIIIDGHIYHGRTGAAAEGGHMSIDYHGPQCRCGKRGCIEAFASGPAISKRARTKLETGQQSSLLDLAHGNIQGITSEMVNQAQKAGDEVASEVLAETIELLTIWFGNIVDLLEPDVMIVGGGVGSLLKPYLLEIQDRLPDCCVNRRCQEIPLLPARYGENAGIVGGAALCFASLEGTTEPNVS